MLDDADDDDDWNKQREWEEAKLAVRLIGEAFRDPTVMGDLITAGVGDADFTAPTLARVFSLAVPIWRQHGRVDVSLVEEALGLFYDQGTAGAVVAICTRARPLHSRDDVGTLLSHMRRRVGVRRVGKMAAWLTEAAGRKGADLSALVARARGELDSISATAAVLDGADGVELATIAHEQLTGLRKAMDTSPLGVPDIDDALGGGAPISRSTLVYAPLGVGKTTYAIHFALTSAVAGEPVVMFTSEADREEMARLLVETMAGYRYPRTLDDETRDRMAALASATARLRELPIWLEDASVDVDAMIAMLRAHKRAHKVRKVIVDYVQDVELSLRDPVLAHVHISKSLRKFAKEKPPVANILMSQVSTPAPASGRAKTQGKLTAEDSAGSKQYPKDAAIVCAIERKRDVLDEKKRNVSSIRIVKNRTTGKAAEAWMKWHPESNRLTPCTKDGEEITRVEVDDANEAPPDTTPFDEEGASREQA